MRGAHRWRGKFPAFGAQANFETVEGSEVAHADRVVVNGDKTVAKFLLQVLDLAFAVIGQAELRTEKKDFFVGLLVKRDDEGHKVGHPAAVDAAAFWRKSSLAKQVERSFVVDKNAEMRRDFFEAGHRAAGLIEGVVEYAHAVFDEKGEEFAEATSEFLRTLTFENEPPFFVDRAGGSGEIEHALNTDHASWHEIEVCVAGDGENLTDGRVPVAVESGHAQEVFVLSIGDFRREVERGQTLGKKAGVFEPIGPSVEVKKADATAECAGGGNGHI